MNSIGNAEPAKLNWLASRRHYNSALMMRPLGRFTGDALLYFFGVSAVAKVSVLLPRGSPGGQDGRILARRVNACKSLVLI